MHMCPRRLEPYTRSAPQDLMHPPARSALGKVAPVQGLAHPEQYSRMPTDTVSHWCSPSERARRPVRPRVQARSERRLELGAPLAKPAPGHAGTPCKNPASAIADG